MESNGKSVGRDGNLLTMRLELLFGEPELMHNMLFSIHQGTKLIPSDLLVYKTVVWR
jgi:glucose-6-phosphate isomerase